LRMLTRNLNKAHCLFSIFCVVNIFTGYKVSVL